MRSMTTGRSKNMFCNNHYDRPRRYNFPRRRRVSLDEVRSKSTVFAMTHDYSLGICALVDVDNMGFCGNNLDARYYMFDLDGEPCIYFKFK